MVEFGPLALSDVQSRLAADGKSRNYVNATISIIMRMVKRGVSQQKVCADVWHALQAVEGLKKGRTAARETAPIGPVNDALYGATLG